MAYAVPKLTDFSATALDSAVREFFSALDQESAAVGSENDWKAFRDSWMARTTETVERIKPKRSVYAGARGGRIDGTAKPEGVSLKSQVGIPYGIVERPLDITLPGIRRPIGV